MFIPTYYRRTLRAARLDHRGEFCSTEFLNYMVEQGIQHLLTAPHTPQQNSVVEHVNQTVTEAAWVMLQVTGMSPGFWEFSVATAVHIWNRAPSLVTGYVSPHEHLLKSALDLSYLQTFGCLAYAHTNTQWTKYDPTSRKLVFIGYNPSTKEYMLWNPLSHSTVVSTDVVFEETVFPLKTEKTATKPPSIPE